MIYNLMRESPVFCYCSAPRFLFSVNAKILSLRLTSDLQRYKQLVSMSQKTIYILNAKSQRRKDAKFKFFVSLHLRVLNSRY